MQSGLSVARTAEVAISENLRCIRGAIDAAARRAGRDPDIIRLITVSKMQPWTRVNAAIAAGQRSFGENMLQEQSYLFGTSGASIVDQSATAGWPESEYLQPLEGIGAHEAHDPADPCGFFKWNCTSR